MSKSLIFQLDYLPVGAHYNNLRYILKKEHWNTIVNNVRKCKKYKCEFCNRQFNPKNTKVLKYLHCHEEWTFNYENKHQILTNLLLLCNDCHNCQHINFATLVNKEDKTLNHFKKVNNLSQSDFNELKRNNLLFRNNCSDKSEISREQLDRVEEWSFKMGVSLSNYFEDVTIAEKMQEFLDYISSF